jgi:hypothetical protein
LAPSQNVTLYVAGIITLVLVAVALLCGVGAWLKKSKRSKEACSTKAAVTKVRMDQSVMIKLI